jgi:ABC-type molybdenum transport system ATPase subunit/photorepair protein PhrA
MISGFCREFTKLPLEFAAEADKFNFKIRRKCWLMALDSILEIKDLQVSINENEILKFELKVNRGEIHAIMGPNGSGKVLFKSSCRSPSLFYLKR